MSYKNHEFVIPDIEEKLRDASHQKDRKRVKLLLNNVWHQVKGELEDLTEKQRRGLCDLFERYGESNHFRSVSEKIWLGGIEESEQPVESIRHASLSEENGSLKVKFGKRLVHLAGGAIIVENN